jgi:hypothetical protein
MEPGNSITRMEVQYIVSNSFDDSGTIIALISFATGPFWHLAA